MITPQKLIFALWAYRKQYKSMTGKYQGTTML